MLAYHRHVCKRSGQLKSATSLANKPCADPTQYTVRLALQYHGTGEYHGRVQLPCEFGAGAGHLLGLESDECVRRPSSVMLGLQSPTDGLD
jgi:hypothetical protein